MSKKYEERRRYRIGDFEYLLDDEDRTAWISEGNSGGARVYTLPECVVIEGMEYTITSVEHGAYRTPHDAFLEEVFFPDVYLYYDEYAFLNSHIRKIHLGKGIRSYCPLMSATHDVKVKIDQENPYIKMSDDGNMVLTKDGKELISIVRDVPEAVIPEGVESIAGWAVSCKHILKRIQLPSTLKSIAIEGIIENRELESLVVPEGVTRLGHQAFCGDTKMTLLDLPSSLTKLDCDTIMDDMALHALVLRCPTVVSVDILSENWPEYIPWRTCHLVVPQRLIPEYRQHPYWGWFKQIDPLER